MEEKKVLYVFDEKSLKYVPYKPSRKKKIFKFLLGFGGVCVVISQIIAILVVAFKSNEKETLKRKYNELLTIVAEISKKSQIIEKALADIEEKNKNVYAILLQSKDTGQILVGYGGYSKSPQLLWNSELAPTLKELDERVDLLAKKAYFLRKRIENIHRLAKEKIDFLRSIPIILPIKIKDWNQIVSGVGYRIDPVYKIRNFHAGIDIVCDIGTNVYATADGRVVFAGNNGNGYGFHIIIEHNNGYQTLYAHLSEVLVNEGQFVERGAIIGRSGNSGKSVGPHLHYEILLNGVHQNPLNYFFKDLDPSEYNKIVDNVNRKPIHLD